MMKLLFENNGFSYFELPLQSEEKPAEFTQALSLWQSKFIDGKLPCWDDFDFYDFTGLHGWVALSEITFNPTDIYYRLFGTKIVELIGEDLTGKRYSETGPNFYHWQDDLNYYEQISQNRHMGYAAGSFERSGQPSKRASFLDIPLAASDRESDQITHLLEITYLHP